jgi:predicted PurR-regulated permease PerM
MALEPLVQLLERHGLRRGVAIAVTFGAAAFAALAFAYLAFAPLVSELDHFARDLPRLLQELTHGRGRLGFLEQRFQIVEKAQALVSSRGLAGPASQTFGAVGKVLKTGGAVVFVAFLTLFVQLGGRAWFESAVSLTPAQHRSRIRRAGRGVSRAVGGYVAGNLLISVVAGAVTAAVLFATGVPYAIPLGLVAALLDLIPMIGATLATVIVAGVSLSHGLPATAIVVLVMTLYQQVENHTLQQLVYNRTVQLSPLAIALSVATGAELGGVVGALLGIPFAGALKAVFAEVAAWRRGDEAPA